jgi:hypothetical protein
MRRGFESCGTPLSPRCSKRIADFVSQRLSWPARDLQQRAVIALQEDKQFYAPLQLLRTLFLTICQGRANCGV